MRRLSIRARIACSAALIAALLLGALAALLAVELRASASDAVAALARDDLRPFVTDLRTQPDEAPDAASPGALVLVVDPAGAVRRDSMPSVLARAASRVLDGATVAVDGVRYRVETAAVTVDGGTWHLAAARDVGAGEADAARIGLTLAIAVPIVAAGTGLVAWIVATLVLRPVEFMRRAAERIRETRSAEVLPAGPPDDELAALGRTLNGLLGDLHDALEHERRLTADASHELRTPIAVLSAQVELAGSPPSDAEIADIRRSVARLAVVADDLLELSRPQGASRARTPVRELVTEAMDAVDRGRLLAAAGATVDLELDPALDECAVCAIDRVAFGRVLANLLGNAVAATAAGSVTVRLDGTPGIVVLSVADTGSGLPPDFLPRAFDRFSRPDDAGARAGAGLGLAVVARLVDAAGGVVSLTNQQGGGALASVTLLAGAPSVRAAPPAAPARTFEVGPQRGPGDREGARSRTP